MCGLPSMTCCCCWSSSWLQFLWFAGKFAHTVDRDFQNFAGTDLVKMPLATTPATCQHTQSFCLLLARKRSPGSSPPGLPSSLVKACHPQVSVEVACCHIAILVCSYLLLVKVHFTPFSYHRHPTLGRHAVLRIAINLQCVSCLLWWWSTLDRPHWMSFPTTFFHWRRLTFLSCRWLARLLFGGFPLLIFAVLLSEYKSSDICRLSCQQHCRVGILVVALFFCPFLIFLSFIHSESPSIQFCAAGDRFDGSAFFCRGGQISFTTFTTARFAFSYIGCCLLHVYTSNFAHILNLCPVENVDVLAYYLSWTFQLIYLTAARRTYYASDASLLVKLKSYENIMVMQPTDNRLR